MKIRIGFVSNSSSCSFCVYGIRVEEGKIDYDKEEALGKSGLSVEMFQSDDKAVGISWSSIKDDETGKQFKERIEKLIKEHFEGELQFGTQEDGYYNG